MILTTKRILLRSFLESDWPVIHTLYSQPQTVQYNPGGYPDDETSTKDLVKSWVYQHEVVDPGEYTFLIADNTDGSFIGVISLRLGKKKYSNAEVWYKLEPTKWNKGYATEALRAVLNFGFHTLNLHRIECGCSVKNIASFKVMEKAGMVREGVHRALLPLEDGWHDACIYAILKSEFRS